MDATESKHDYNQPYKPCYNCPDGYVWNSNGPTSKCCPICAGHAMLNLDGSKLRPSQVKEVT